MKVSLKVSDPVRNESSLLVRSEDWNIEDADLAIEIIPEDGGVVGDFGQSATDAPKKNRTSYGFHQILMVIVITICVAFLIVVVNDVWLGTMTFKIYMDYLAWALAGVGIGSFTKSLNRTSTD